MEVLIGQQLLDAVVSEALKLLNESQVEDRWDELNVHIDPTPQPTLYLPM